MNRLPFLIQTFFYNIVDPMKLHFSCQKQHFPLRRCHKKSKSSCFKHREEKNSPNKTIKNAESNPAIKRSVVRVFHTTTHPAQQQPNIGPENARAFDAVCAGKSFSNPPATERTPRGVRKAQLFFLRGEKAKICNS